MNTSARAGLVAVFAARLARRAGRRSGHGAMAVRERIGLTRDSSAVVLEVGGRLLDVPKATASLWLRYEDASADGRRYGLGGGLTHVGRRLGEARTRAQAAAGTPAFELPSYTTAKIAASSRVRNIPSSGFLITLCR